jgi:hypothetical protein
MNNNAVKSETIEIDGIEFYWNISHEATWVTSGGVRLLGMTILVQSKEPSKRNLVLQFDPEMRRRKSKAQDQRLKISDRGLIECIRQAMAAGWDPESRGKPFTFQAGSVLAT